MSDDSLLGFLITERDKNLALAKKYRDSIERAIKIGTPCKDGSYRGPYGNAQDPIHGHHYSPRIRKAAIDAELRAAKFDALFLALAIPKPNKG